MSLKRFLHDQYAATLNEACTWLGLSKGRAVEYTRLLKEFGKQGKRLRTHILGINESFEVVDMYEPWKDRVDLFPGLKKKINSSLMKGSVLSEDENALTSTNEPRNRAFNYLLAGKLLHSGAMVTVVDGIARNGITHSHNDDIVVDLSGTIVAIECKRPFLKKSLEIRVKEGCKKLKGRVGVVAVDCSRLVRPADKVFEGDSAEAAATFLDKQIQLLITPKITAHLEKPILGLIAFARMPAMTRVSQSVIVTSQGTPAVRSFRPDSVTHILVFPTPNAGSAPLLREMFLFLARTP
jgi:hypothetical protein